MSKLPAFQFYPGDWRKDPGVQSLNFHDRGVWFEMLCLMHESSERGVLTLNGKPITIEALARLLGVTAGECETTVQTLLDYGVAERREDGAIYSRRMVRDEGIRQQKREAGKQGGVAKAKQTSSRTPSKPVAQPLAESKQTSSKTPGKRLAKPLAKSGSSSSTSTSPSGSSSATQKKSSPDSDSGFDEFWEAYPTRNGKKGNKGQALAEWRKLDMTTRRRVYVAAQNLAKSDSYPPDAQRFLIPPHRSDGADPRWMEWEHVEPDKPVPKQRIHNQNQSGGSADDELIRRKLKLTGSDG